jgi:hypothetical protein
MENRNLPMQRRLKFSLLVVVSQILLVALAISWLVHMGIIAVAGSAYFVLVGQVRRLGERRGSDRRRSDDR